MSDPRDELKPRIRRILVERLFLQVDPDQLKDDTSLTATYGVDSVRLFDMAVGLEEDFDVSFEDEELQVENFDTVNAIAARLHEKLQA
jgi:acyl carrier protein